MLRSREAFSLVELLLALSLGVILIGLLTSLLWSCNKLLVRQESDRDRNFRLRFFSETLRKEMAETKFDPSDEWLQWKCERNMLTFATTRPEGIARSLIPRGIKQVSYFLDPAKRALIRRVFPVPKRGQENLSPNQTIILGGVSKISFRFFNSREWLTNWGNITQSRPPQALEVTLDLDSPFAFRPGVFRTAAIIP